MALGKRKRIDDSLVNTGVKRRKIWADLHNIISSWNSQAVNSFVALHLPPPRPPSFPLFRLPAEVRNHIWEYLYGNLTVHVGLKSFNKLAEASYKDLTYTIRRKMTYPHYETSFKLPPRVCKQFYSEATAAFYASSTLSFSAPHSFRAFALSPHPCVSRIQHIRIPRLTHRWGEALTSSLVGRLKSVRGVRLTHHYLRCIGTRPIPRATHPTWKGFWRIVRAFQQHELEEKRSIFEVVVHDLMYENHGRQTGSRTAGTMVRPGKPHYDEMLKLQRKLTDGLLQYVPRRLSRRGAAEA